jgi:hypothetical protein
MRCAYDNTSATFTAYGALQASTNDGIFPSNQWARGLISFGCWQAGHYQVIVFARDRCPMFVDVLPL